MGNVRNESTYTATSQSFESQMASLDFNQTRGTVFAKKRKQLSQGRVLTPAILEAQ